MICTFICGQKEYRIASTSISLKGTVELKLERMQHPNQPKKKRMQHHIYFQ